MQTQDFYKFKLGFKGKLIENSVDAFDVANTILATSQSLQELAVIHFGEQTAKEIKLNINAFKQGSLETDFLMFYNVAKDNIAPLLPIVGSIYETGKTILSGYKTYIDVKKLLKGRRPKKVVAKDNSTVSITAFDNATINITYNDFRALQSPTLAKNVEKSILPLTKEGSELEEIVIESEEKNTLTIKRSDTPYLMASEETQVLSEVKYKGIISKIDTKACSGYLDIGSKRLPFNYEKSLPQENFLILVESLKRRIQIYLIGQVTMDYQNNPRNMFVKDVQSDVKLFE
ncbi:MAG: hypothetical protein AAB739_03815 [Patescibacteria group bacterium]